MSAHSTGPPGWRRLALAEFAGNRFYAARSLTPEAGWTVLSTPRLAGPFDRPACAVTVLLARSPLPSEETIRPLISRALLTATVDVGLTEAERDTAQAVLAGPVQNAFARKGAIEWFDQRGSLLAHVDAYGLEPSAQISTWVADELARALVDCVTGPGDAGLIRAVLRFPVAAAAAAFQLSLDRARVTSALRLQAVDGVVTRTQAESVLGELLFDESVKGASDQATPVIAVLAAHLCELLTDVLEPDLDDSERLLLHDDPTQLPRTLSLSVPAIRGTQDVVFETSLSEVLTPARAVSDRIVTLVALGTHEPPLETVPPRKRSPRRREPGASLPLIARKERLVSLSLAVTPALANRPSAAELVTSDVTMPLAQSARVRWWAAHDVVAPEREDIGEGPIVDDPNATTYPDHENANIWAAPDYRLVVPNPNDDPTTSPFLYSFSQQGTSQSLRPGIDATIRITLHAEEAPAGQQPIATSGETALLLIPFREPTSGETIVQSAIGDVRRDGATLRIEVRLADDVARLAYGALAYAGFQDEPAQLKLAASFRAWRPVPPEAHVVFGGKLAPIALRTHDDPVVPIPDQVLFDPHRLEIAQHSQRIRLIPGGNGNGLRERGLTDLASVRRTRARDLDEPQARRLPAAALVAKPELIGGGRIGTNGQRPRYGQQTVVREQVIDLLFPCNELGGLYRQRQADGSEQAVGCQDILRLGEIVYRLYEQVTDLQSERYSIFRALAQPGRFLLLPARYRITRYGPSEPSDRAFRPAALLYGLLQPDPTQNRYYLTATLEPDVAPFERQAIIDRLVTITPAGVTPSLHLPTDPVCAAERTYQWALPSGLSMPEVTQLQNGFQVSVSSGLDNALLLTELIEHSGLQGSVSFALPDGMTLVSDLCLDSVITGPYLGGPLRLTPAAGEMLVENPTERAIDVLELRGGEGSVAVNQTIPPSGRITTAKPTGDGHIVARFRAHDEPMSLKQMRVFVEDVIADVIFVNLIDFKAHDLTAVEVFCHLQGESEAFTATLGERQSAKIELTLPITDYLQKQILLYQVKTTPSSGTASVSDWLSWDIARQGCVISITWEATAGTTDV